MVYQPAFYHVHEFVVASRVRRQNKEAWIDKIADRVEDDPFHHFAIEKLESHPDAVHDGGPRMKVQMIAPGLPSKLFT